jgi:hypothetical protein
MDDFLKAMTFNYPEYIPLQGAMLPATWMKYKEEFDEITLRYPEVFHRETKRSDYYRRPHNYMPGSFTDEWGCVWSNINDGFESYVTGNPVPNRDDVNHMKIPEVDGGLPHGFMYLRLTYIRGFEEMMVDFAEEPPELQKLIDMVLAYNIRQTAIMLKNDKNEMVGFADDLGMQHGLAIGPEKWRKYLKPCFETIFKMCKDDGRYIKMHTDGCIYEIIPDLIDCGLTAVNPQFRANGIDNLVRTCRNKIGVHLDLDRQMFPFASRKDIFDHVHECVEKLGTKQGGLGLFAEIGPDVKLETVVDICDAMMKYRTFYK